MTNRVLSVPARVGPLQVDDFPDDCKRERKGALHVRPSSTLVVSEGEWQHLKGKHPELAARLTDITPQPAPAPAATPTVVPVTDQEPKEEAKPSGRRGRGRSRGSSDDE